MTHDDLKAMAARPAFNRTQRATLLAIADDLHADHAAAAQEIDAHGQLFEANKAWMTAAQIEDFGRLLIRARNALDAEAYPRALQYSAALDALNEEITATKQSRTAAD